MIPPSGKWLFQPPPWAVLDFDNPILKDVEHVISGSAAFLNRGQYNDSLRTTATPPVPTFQPSGLSYRLTGVNAHLATNAGGWVNARSEWTVYAFGVPRSLAANSAISVIAETPGGTRDRSIQFNTAGNILGGLQDTGGVKRVTGTTTIVANAPVSAAVRASTTALGVYVNGVSDATPTTVVNNGLASYTSPEVVCGYGGIGAGFGSTQGSAFDLSLVIWWSRALTDAEILSIHEYPWQVFRSPKRIFVPEVVSGTTNDLLADDLQSTSSVSTPTLGQTHELLANNLQSTSSVSTPSVAAFSNVDNLLADNLQSLSQLSTPALGQTHGLLANDLQSASSVSTPTVGQAHVLLADNLQSASSVSTPSISQSNALLANNLQSVSTVSTPTIGSLGVSALLANDLQSVSVISTPSLLQRKPINYAASASITSLSAITFYQNSNKWYGY